MESLVVPNVYGLIMPISEPDSHLLLQERWKPDTDPDNSGRLELPGGKWRAWESASDCLQREVAEETGLNITMDGSHVESIPLGGDTVDVLDPVMVVQMVKGPYPSTITLLRGAAEGTPSNRGDGARNATWHRVEELRVLLGRSPEHFTALTFAILTRALRRSVL